MIKLRIAITLLAVLLISSCRAPAEKAAVERLESQLEKVFVKYSAYVQDDSSISTKEAKDDELKKIESIRSIVTSLKNASKE